jgi:hypothetical protein
MKRLPVSFLDKALLNGRNIVETIIGHIKEGSCWVPGWWLWRGSAEARSLI